VFVTMGGDAQPQILLQVATRLFAAGSDVADAIAAPRWALQGRATGFDTWTSGRPPAVGVEGHAPEGWMPGLAARGHDVVAAPAFDSGFGHAHAIVVEPTRTFAAAADPRSRVGSANGI
jgi:gamma-glutamyltranspeptidase/glutathione hydrolase